MGYVDIHIQSSSIFSHVISHHVSFTFFVVYYFYLLPVVRLGLFPTM